MLIDGLNPTARLISGSRVGVWGGTNGGRGPRIYNRGLGVEPPEGSRAETLVKEVKGLKLKVLISQSINTFITRHSTEARATVQIMLKQREMS